MLLSNAANLVYGVKEGYDISVLNDCKAVVEKKGFVSTGTLTYAAGEILEIEFPQYDRFELGESVKVMVYAKGGIYVFESTVIAKDINALIILNPPENRRKFQDKRQDPRVPVGQQGKVLSLIEAKRKTERKFTDPLPIKIDNVSMTGAGLLFSIDLPLQVQSQLHLEMDIGTLVECRTEIIHMKRSEEGTLCGTKIIDIDAEHAHKLRSFILKSQIEAYYLQKAEKAAEQLTGVKQGDDVGLDGNPSDSTADVHAPHAYYITDNRGDSSGT